MTHKEVMQQALEALKGADAIDTDMQDAIYTLYEALEQPKQEPVGTFDVAINERTAAINYDYRKHKLVSGTKLYTTPPAAQPEQGPVPIDGNTSDGYHTFNELYEFRKAYNAALFNEWAAGGKCSVHKSWRHHDGELCFGGGWFIVVAVLPEGQISNHYEAKNWSLFAIPETERALFKFDGHNGSDVVARLKAYTTPPAAQQRKPLTDEEIEKLYKRSAGYGGDDFHSFARAIEAAQDTKENKNDQT